MYSYEDRLRAVRLYIKLGKRGGLTIRQLGYPTKNALKSWHREYERSTDVSAGYARQAKYTEAQQQQAVAHYLENGRCISATIRALGYPVGNCFAPGFRSGARSRARASLDDLESCPRRRSSRRSLRCACGKAARSLSPRNWACPDQRCTTGSISCSAATYPPP